MIGGGNRFNGSPLFMLLFRNMKVSMSSLKGNLQ